MAPTGTGTWDERELIGEITNGEEDWPFTWKYDKQVLLAHIYIEAIGENGLTALESINVTTEN